MVPTNGSSTNMAGGGGPEVPKEAKKKAENGGRFRGGWRVGCNLEIDHMRQLWRKEPSKEEEEETWGTNVNKDSTGSIDWVH
jgi:hypothetical protein